MSASSTTTSYAPANYKLAIIKYFDYIISQIDVDAETLLAHLDEEASDARDDADRQRIIAATVDSINSSRDTFVREVNRVQQQAIERIARGHDAVAAAAGAHMFASGLCQYVDKATLDAVLSVDNCVEKQRQRQQQNRQRSVFGALVRFDTYFNDGFVDYLKKWAKSSNQVVATSRARLVSDVDVVLDEHLIFAKLFERQLTELWEKEDTLLVALDAAYLSGVSRLEFNKMRIRSLVVSDAGTDETISTFSTASLRVVSAHLAELDLSCNQLETVPASAFRGLSRLVSLDLSWNHLRKLDVNSLRPLGKLDRLILAANRISSLNSELFVAQSALSHLDVSENRLQSLGSSPFRHLSALKSLDLSSNRIESLDDESFVGLQALEILDLKATGSETSRLRQVSAGAFWPLVHCRTIDMSKQQVRALDPSGATFTYQRDHLTHLWLRSSDEQLLASHSLRPLEHLTHLTLTGIQSYKSEPIQLRREHFAPHKHLTHVHITNYSISRIEATTFVDLKRLVSLTLSENSLKTADLALSSSLRALDLSSNEIATLGDYAFAALAELRSLSLHANRLERLHLKTFNGLVRLVDLNLSDNPLTRLDAGALDSMPALERLDMSDTRIRVVAGLDLFERLAKLTELRMRSLYSGGPSPAAVAVAAAAAAARTSLSSMSSLSSGGVECRVRIEADSFRQLVSLRLLNLQSNRLRRVDEQLLGGLVHLEELDLSNNEIDAIEADAFARLVKLRELVLNNNKLTSESVDLGAALAPLADQLHVLDLSFNSLDVAALVGQVANTFGRMAQLKLLNLADNKPSDEATVAQLRTALAQALASHVEFII